MSYDENTIEIEGYGRVSHTGKIPVYELLEGEDVTESSISKVVLGNMEVSYVIGEEEVCAILIRTPAVIENIRVLLLADDGGKFRSAVYLKADVDASIKFGETVSDYAAGTLLDVSTWFTERDDTFPFSLRRRLERFFCVMKWEIPSQTDIPAVWRCAVTRRATPL